MGSGSSLGRRESGNVSDDLLNEVGRMISAEEHFKDLEHEAERRRLELAQITVSSARKRWLKAGTAVRVATMLTSLTRSQPLASDHLAPRSRSAIIPESPRASTPAHPEWGSPIEDSGAAAFGASVARSRSHADADETHDQLVKQFSRECVNPALSLSCLPWVTVSGLCFSSPWQ